MDCHLSMTDEILSNNVQTIDNVILSSAWFPRWVASNVTFFIQYQKLIGKNSIYHSSSNNACTNCKFTIWLQMWTVFLWLQFLLSIQTTPSSITKKIPISPTLTPWAMTIVSARLFYNCENEFRHLKFRLEAMICLDFISHKNRWGLISLSECRNSTNYN